MKLKGLVLTSLTAATLFASLLPGCTTTPTEAAESYVAVVPQILYSGGQDSVSLTLTSGDRLVASNVEMTLSKGKDRILQTQGTINGKGTLEFTVPDVPEGDYEISIKGNGFADKAPVKIVNQFLVFLETDKPIYKPGQTIHMRAMTLNADLKPVSEKVTVDVLDAKGIKIFRSEVQTGDYGLATLDLPISTEPNLGVWKINASTEKAKTQLDVRVEEYVLPKYEVKVNLSKEWFLASEPIKGKISAEYSFGKPVSGEVEIKASRYVGQWEEYATLTKPIDASMDFELPAVKYVAGVPASGGQGNVMLDVIVREKSTSYEEKTNELLTIAQSAVNTEIIPEGQVFKPGLPFGILVTTRTPDNKPLEQKVNVTITYLDGQYQEVKKEDKNVQTRKGKAIFEITPPDKAVALVIDASTDDSQASKVLEASYSPSGNFIHVEQTSDGVPPIGQDIQFRVFSTTEAANFYYEVISRGKVVFTDFTKNHDISFTTTPLMAPSSRLLVYQILPNSEVAADYVPFDVKAAYPQTVKVEFSKDEAKPGEELNLNIQTQGQARVGIAAVDKSVFILAENRLNLQQVFDELERLYMQPQTELHEVTIFPAITTRGAKDIFDAAGVVVLSNSQIPSGKEYRAEKAPNPWNGIWRFFRGDGGIAEMGELVPVMALPPAAPAFDQKSASSGLAEVQRVRQFFPETWLWDEITTAANGNATLKVTVPDTITTWMLRAVAISKDKGLGVSETQLKAFQPFFLSADLPYSAIRGEEFPVQIAIYNYLDKSQSVQVNIDKADWFDLVDEAQKTADIAPNDIGGVSFKISPNKLGINEIKVTARSTQAADAVIKTLIVEPEGVSREVVDNLVLSDGISKTIDTTIPPDAIVDSGRAVLTVTSSYLTQTIEGLDSLIQMPFGCGEQNMILFAPDVFITKYLQETRQLKPEIMAKAEKLMITGYQRELTYRRSDGSFSAFGQSDPEGSLWLTAFVLKSFAQAKGLIYIDDNVLDKAKTWLTSHQNSDGSFDIVGFVHHQEMIGGLKGKTALTAHTAIALMEAGEKTSSGKAVTYLESKLGETDDPYTLALLTYALELTDSGKKGEAHDKLMELAKEDENGLHWGNGPIDGPEPMQGQPKLARPEIYPPMPRDADVETTAYATLALIKHGDAVNASKAGKWLVSKRNAYGGFSSTQSTVVALQALTEFSTNNRADVELSINIKSSNGEKELKIKQSNFDVLQVIDVPVDDNVEISVKGKGEAIAQVVRRFNLPKAENPDPILTVDVKYDAAEVEVNDQVTVSVNVGFNPPEPMEAGMTVVDISVPTGFAPVTESVAEAVKNNDHIKRYDIAGRKVIFYVENMKPGDKVSFNFKVKALYPVKAKGVTSQVYSYYQPEIRGETLITGIQVSGK